MAGFAPHPVTLRQLQYLVAVADLRSFRRAAEACAVAQPSLSAQIAQLEEAIGVRVFERLPRGVVITEAGAPVLDRARRTLLEADDLVATAARSRDPLAGLLRIAIVPTIAPYLLPDAAPTLRARFPRLRLLWFEEKTRALVERVASGELDAGILALDSELGGLAHAALGRDPFVVAAPPGHRLVAGDGPLRTAQLAGETLLLLDDGHCFRDQALDVCRRAHAAEASLRATSLSTLAQMVAGGAGATLLPTISIATENRARGLVCRPFGARGPARTLVLAWRRTSAATAALAALAEALRPVVERLCGQPAAPPRASLRPAADRRRPR